MHISAIEHNSLAYRQMIDLRIHELLQPIGVPVSYINEEKEKNDFLLAAFEGEEMVGCCVLTPKGNTTVQLRQMAVRNDFRGQGIGAAIIAFAESFSRRHGYKVLMMHARDPVIGFYEKCGYSIFGAAFTEVGIGHHKMQKHLS